MGRFFRETCQENLPLPFLLEKFSKGQRAEEENNGTHPLTVKVKEW